MKGPLIRVLVTALIFYIGLSTVWQIINMKAPYIAAVASVAFIFFYLVFLDFKNIRSKLPGIRSKNKFRRTCGYLSYIIFALILMQVAGLFSPKLNLVINTPIEVSETPITIEGQTNPGNKLILITERKEINPTFADNEGDFYFNNIPLTSGKNDFIIEVEDTKFNESREVPFEVYLIDDSNDN